MTTQTQKENQNAMTVAEATKYSRMVAEEFCDAIADVLCCFDGTRVESALYGLFATSPEFGHRANEPIHYDELARGFLHLLDSNVLIPEFPLSGVAEEQLEELRKRFAAAKSKSASASAASSSSQPASDPNDFSKMSQDQFEATPTSDARRLYKSNASFRQRADYFWGGGR